MTKLKVTQTRSPIGGTENQRATLRSLGLRKIGQTVEIDAEGSEACEALDAICNLIGRKFDERE